MNWWVKFGMGQIWDTHELDKAKSLPSNPILGEGQIWDTHELGQI